MAPKELRALLLLMDNPNGLYGSEIVNMSAGEIGRGTVYTLLERLVAKGFIREVEEAPTPAFQMARTRHLINASGKKAVNDYLLSLNLKRGGPAYA